MNKGDQIMTESKMVLVNEPTRIKYEHENKRN